jgi:hypothetical protein
MTAHDDEIQRRKNLTFEQAEGLAPLPTQLARTEVSQELRAVLWKYLHEQIDESSESGGYGPHLGKPWRHILKEVHVYREHKLVDDFSTDLKPALAAVRRVFEKGSYSDIYGWLQFVLGINRSREFVERIAKILRYCRSPYRIVADDVIFPIGTDEEATTVNKAFVDLKATGFAGSREHLKSASAELGAGNFSDSIRESVHAVESVVRILEPSGDFSKALAKLEAKAKIHGALVSGFKSIYGFSSDEQGIRHPLLDKGAPAVDEVDAMFMLGACSAFISYLINKSRGAGMLI